MCAEKIVKGVVHGGGHELPRTKARSKLQRLLGIVSLMNLVFIEYDTFPVVGGERN